MKYNNFFALLKIINNDERIRYLVGGTICTVSGYILPLMLYGLLHSFLHYITTSTISACINISFAFLIHKLYVFRSTGAWLKEYIRCYVVYGSVFLLYIFFVWAMVEYLHVSYAVSHCAVNTCAIVMTYIAHKKFTFRSADAPVH